MIESIFTIDYEIYGNGEGSLKEHVYEPAEKLMAVFRNGICDLFLLLRPLNLK